MKKTALSAALLCLAQSTLHADVPLYINYQGKVADSTGLPLGASGTAASPTAAPVNRKVIFRVFDAATGGNRLWTEEQTATISLGVFSVLLGNGINPTGTANGESRPALDTVFTPSGATSRFLEITVDNGDNAINASDVAISPRQQITSTAFAMHAKVADGIASSTDLTINPGTGTATNYGLGWYGTGRTFNSVAVDGPVLYGNSGGALGSVVGTTKNITLNWNASGQVGVGATSSYETNNKLTLQGDDSTTPARQLVIRGNTDTTERLNIGFDTTANQATLQSWTAASTTGNMLLNPSGGNVGIGTTSPISKLDVNGNVNVSGHLYIGEGQTIYGKNTSGGWEATFWPRAGNGTYVNYGANGFIIRNNSSVTTMFMSDANNVGIGTTSPAYKLDVAGTAQVTSNLNVGGTAAVASTLSVGGTVTAPSFTGSGANLTSNTVPTAALVAAVREALCPPGSIMAFGGTTAPSGWLLCNGDSVSRTTYATLFSAISTAYGTASGSTFNVPDFRGRFLRGTTTDAARDPDYASRTASTTGGNTGGNVGSFQADAFKAHTHTLPTDSSGLNGDMQTITGTNGSDEGFLNPSGSTGGNETRPVNVTVNYIIKY